MPVRIIPFVNNEYYYHVFNRGVAKIPIFTGRKDYKRFIECMIYYSLEGPKPRFSLFTSETILDHSTKIAEIVCYCLMPNHFHLLVKQIRDGGISEFISKLTNSYTKYFNTKNNRVGHLFQGMFKAVHIETNEQLIHVSRYIHLNPLTSYVAKDLETYQWSSYLEYIKIMNKNKEICNKKIILEQFKSVNNYSKFIQDSEDYAIKLELVKHTFLDFEDNP